MSLAKDFVSLPPREEACVMPDFMDILKKFFKGIKKIVLRSLGYLVIKTSPNV